MNNLFSEDIKDKVCIITGGCGVFGNIFAQGLLQAGAKVAIIDYKKGRCEECSQFIAKKAKAPVLCVVANVLALTSIEPACLELFKAAIRLLYPSRTLFS